MSGKPIWYELMTPDPGAVAGFYRDVLGWEIPAEGQAMPNGSEYRAIERSDGGNAGGVLTISESMASMGTKPGWMTYFHVEDVDAAVARAIDLGATVHMPPMTMSGAGRLAMLSDPRGGPFYLMTPTPPPDRPDAQSDVFEPNVPGHCWWNELHTPDEPGATSFYTALFGWQADNGMPMGEHGFYRFVEIDGRAIGAINPWVEEATVFGWRPYFGVADIDAAKAAAESAGGTILHEVHEVPGGDFIFNAADPAGAPLGLVGPRKA